jgi:hypothetical protein
MLRPETCKILRASICPPSTPAPRSTRSVRQAVGADRVTALVTPTLYSGEVVPVVLRKLRPLSRAGAAAVLGFL